MRRDDMPKPFADHSDSERLQYKYEQDSRFLPYWVWQVASSAVGTAIAIGVARFVGVL